MLSKDKKMIGKFRGILICMATLLVISVACEKDPCEECTTIIETYDDGTVITYERCVEIDCNLLY